MRRTLLSQCYFRFRWLILTACMSTPLLAGAEATPQPDPKRDPHALFVELDAEIQAIKDEILVVNRDILILEEATSTPGEQPLIVLVTVEQRGPANPGTISLNLDGNLVSQHKYTASENAALRAGGVHRLYDSRIREGQHNLLVTVTGRTNGGKEFRRQQKTTISVADGRHYLELELGISGKTPEPDVNIRLWRQ